jgi:hypothetical protein
MEETNTMEIYNSFRTVPQEAQKKIEAGKLKGMTDINPMWRIKMLTDRFGPSGFGWYTEIVDRWIDSVNEQYCVQIRINLYVKYNGEWSKPIEGIGGSMLYGKGVGTDTISDEAYKMAYTDALSIACKALGMAADIYYAKDRTKYDAAQPTQPTATPQTNQFNPEPISTPPLESQNISVAGLFPTQDMPDTIMDDLTIKINAAENEIALRGIFQDAKVLLAKRPDDLAAIKTAIIKKQRSMSNGTNS